MKKNKYKQQNHKKQRDEEYAKVTLHMHPLGTKTIPIFNMVPSLKEVSSLLQLSKKGKNLEPCNSNIINKSAIVLLCACWEAYIEDTVLQSFDFLMENILSPTYLPKHLKQIIARSLRQDKNELKIWDMADDGWRNLLAKHKDVMLTKYLGHFNTPKPQNIDQLFLDVLGMSSITKKWKEIEGYSSDHVCELLNRFISIRGAIAHGANDIPCVSYEEIMDYLQLIVNLMVRTGSAVREYIKVTTGKDVAEKYKGTRVMFIKDSETNLEFPLIIKIEDGKESNDLKSERP